MLVKMTPGFNYASHRHMVEKVQFCFTNIGTEILDMF